jgi:hypothetical protein
MTLPSPVLGTALVLGRAMLFNGAPWVTQGACGLSNKPVDVVPSYVPSFVVSVSPRSSNQNERSYGSPAESC